MANDDDISLVRYRYLDASAAVKLVVAEPASSEILAYFESGDPFYMTAPCTTEVLSVLKVKYFYRKELSADQYTKAAYCFLSYLNDRIKIRGPSIDNSHVFWEADELARRHNLDLIDALQLVTIKQGSFVGPGAPLLITADDALARAARVEQIEAWNCATEPRPAHA